MSDYKTYDDSRPGNDCYIDRIWHWLPGQKIAMRTEYVSGYSLRWEATSFDAPHACMPDEVKRWFDVCPRHNEEDIERMIGEDE